jgi:hypothetical protein
MKTVRNWMQQRRKLEAGKRSVRQAPLPIAKRHAQGVSSTTSVDLARDLKRSRVFFGAAKMQSETIASAESVVRSFDAVFADQIPFALANALTASVRSAQAALEDGVEKAFDRPTPFTRKAFGITPATKNNLVASVFAKSIQADYLMPQVTGGQREFKTFEERFAGSAAPQVALPGKGAQLDQHGNISKAAIMRIARDLNSSGTTKRFFKGKPKGGSLPTGIYARVNDNRKIVPLLVFASSASYQQRFDFSAVATEAINRDFEQNLTAAWEQAVATARP